MDLSLGPPPAKDIENIMVFHCFGNLYICRIVFDDGYFVISIESMAGAVFIHHWASQPTKTNKNILFFNVFAISLWSILEVF